MIDIYNSFSIIFNDQITIYEPPIDFYLQKIRALDYFSMMRFADWWWKTIDKSLSKLLIDSNQDHIVITDNQIIELGSHLVKASKSDPYISSLEVMTENLRTTLSSPPKNVLFTVKASRIHYRHLIKAITSNNIFLNAHSWRHLATIGEIHRLFVENQDSHFIVIAPFYYKNFGNKLSLRNYTFIEIHETHGCANIHKTIKQIITVRNAIKQKKVICLFSAGSLSTFMINKLYKSLNNTFLIDVGRALDVYYCYDDVLKCGPNWRWAGAWFGAQDKPRDWTEWAQKYKS